jgi:D-3-phosphoglycerate dehydrogenase / 2-oxoglutarate reductase
MNIAFIDTVHPVLQEMLEAKKIVCTPLYNDDIQSLKSKIKNFDGIVIRSRIRLDAAFLAHATGLKFIARSGAGMENIDLDYCAQKNIVCFNSPEGNRDAVGEHMLGALLMLMNNLKKADNEVRQGIWLREENRGYEITGKTIGIIGFGNMGSAFAKKLSGFDCTILAYDKYKKGFGNNYVKEASLNEIYESSDIVSLHIPLTKETHYLINNDFISKIKKPFYLLNSSRGQNVETQALVEGLKNRKIIGACLDVLEYEKTSFEKLDVSTLPEPMQYLVQAPNVILSPHIAGWTHESYYKLSWHLGDKIIKHFNL